MSATWILERTSEFQADFAALTVVLRSKLGISSRNWHASSVEIHDTPVFDVTVVKLDPNENSASMRSAY